MQWLMTCLLRLIGQKVIQPSVFVCVCVCCICIAWLAMPVLFLLHISEKVQEWGLKNPRNQVNRYCSLHLTVGKPLHETSLADRLRTYIVIYSPFLRIHRPPICSTFDAEIHVNTTNDASWFNHFFLHTRPSRMSARNYSLTLFILLVTTSNYSSTHVYSRPFT